MFLALHSASAAASTPSIVCLSHSFHTRTTHSTHLTHHISHNSPHTTHQLDSNNSPYRTHLTQRNSHTSTHNSSHRTHFTQLTASVFFPCDRCSIGAPGTLGPAHGPAATKRAQNVAPAGQLQEHQMLTCHAETSRGAPHAAFATWKQPRLSSNKARASSPIKSRCCACHADAVPGAPNAPPATQKVEEHNAVLSNAKAAAAERQKRSPNCCACDAEARPETPNAASARTAPRAPNALAVWKQALPNSHGGRTDRPQKVKLLRSPRRSSSRSIACCICHTETIPETQKAVLATRKQR